MERKTLQPEIVRYLLTQCAIGGVIGVFWGVLMLATDTAGLGGLVTGSANPASTLIIFLAGSALAFQPIAIAVAVAIACLAPAGER